MKIGNLKIGVRLAAGLCVAIIFMIGIAGIGLRNLGKLNDNTRDLAVDKVPKVILAYETMAVSTMSHAPCATPCCLPILPSSKPNWSASTSARRKMPCGCNNSAS